MDPEKQRQSESLLYFDQQDAADIDAGQRGHFPRITPFHEFTKDIVEI
jgi:hypothetical protein